MEESKPSSVLHMDWFVKKTANDLKMNEEIVHKVVRHQFESAVAATQKNKRIEVSGIGVFIWKDPAAQRKITTYDKWVMKARNKIAELHREMEQKGVDHTKNITKYTDGIDEMLLKRHVLMNRINELNSDLRGLEKQSVSKRGIKEADR